MSTQESPCLAAQRLERIRRILQDRGAARVEELGRELGVSEATARRDLAALDRRGQIRRVHGGAVWAEGGLEEPGFHDKTALAAQEKATIAEAALQFVGEADALFLDGGSTVLELARLLRGRNRVTIVTNSLEVVKVLAESGPTVLVTGGEFRRLSRTFVGSLTKPFVDALHVDTAFMGTIGLARDGGLTTTDPREAYTKSLILQRARQVVLLADSTKIGKTSFVRFGSLDDVDVVITDRGAPEADLRAFRKAGVKVVRS